MNTEQRLWEWVQVHLAKVLGVPAASITLEKGLSHYGLDSVDAVLMAGELEEAFNVEIDPARFIDCDSLGSMIRTLATDIDRSEDRLANL